MPFRIALSGLNAASTDLEVTGNNIANSATNGFKESRAEFADMYAVSIQDTSNTSGQGAQGSLSWSRQTAVFPTPGLVPIVSIRTVM